MTSLPNTKVRGADLPFTITDYHVHLSDQLPIEAAVALAAERGQRFGILEHPGSAYSSFGLDTDAELRHYAAQLRRFPVHVGLQPMFVGWAGQFSTEALSELDYVLMDADTVPWEGGWLPIWRHDNLHRGPGRFPRRLFPPHHRHPDERASPDLRPAHLPADQLCAPLRRDLDPRPYEHDHRPGQGPRHRAFPARRGFSATDP